MRLSSFRVLSFDCYGTLIDWESGIYAALAPLRARATVATDRATALQAFARHESAQEAETPQLVYREVLAAVHERIAREWDVEPRRDESERFAASIADWPAFPDTVAALQYLTQHARLVILSNVDRESFRASNRRLGVEFDAICTAEDIGSYKPDLRNFAYLLDTVRGLGAERSQLLHVAESLYHDHAPANSVGITSVWIHRRHDQQGHGATRSPEQMPRFAARYTSLSELVKAHQAELCELSSIE